MVVALGNVAGSIAGGFWAQHASSRWALAIPIMLSAIASASLLLAQDRYAALAALCAAGLGYGGLISAIPVVVVMGTGARHFAYNFGRIFSAWGLAGLSGPIIAGTVFDQTGTYNSALVVALIAASIAIILAVLFLDSRKKSVRV
jgi:OFA family oxalate/formate antiporter-like MFS transporter